MKSLARPFPSWVLVAGLLTLSLAGCSKRAENEPVAEPEAVETAMPETATPAAGTPESETAAAEVQAEPRPPIFELDAEELLAMRLPDAETREGWIRLFDGHTLYGWQMAGAANWRIEDKQIIVDQGEPSLLCTSLNWRDYELQLEFQADAETNSGIFLRSPLVPEDPATDCYELNIAPPANPFPTGSLVGRRKLEAAELGEFDSDAWHTFAVRVEGDTVTVRLDDRELYSWTDPMPLPTGRIALQHNQGRVAFRNIRLRPLGFRPLFAAAETPNTEAEEEEATEDTEKAEATGSSEEPESSEESESSEEAAESGKDEDAAGAEAAEPESTEDPLAQWKQYPEMDGKFEIDGEGNLHVRGGLGQLETREEFADFALLAEAKTAGPEQNSGIFFRCIPGDTLMGYECQINNDTVEGDPLRPADCGTGGIFRRQDARIVAAENAEWFTLMLVAHGAEISAWVNGLQVCEWRDTREPNENPRRGLRLEPGTIMLQAHDPGTDVRFRSLRIAPQAAPAEGE